MSSADHVAPPRADAVGDVLDTPDAGPLALRGGVLRVAGYGGGMLLGLISAPLLIRHLDQTGFGHYITALSIATIAIGLAEGGVNAIALREFASRTGRERDTAMANLLGIRILLALAGLVGAVGFAAVAGYSRTLVIGTALAAFGLMIQVLQTLISVPLQGSMRLGWVAAADLLRNAVTTLLIIVLVVAGAGVVSLLAVVIPACLAALLLTVHLVRGSMPLRPAVHVRDFLPLLRETFPNAVAVALGTLYFRVTVIVMSLEASELQTGYFSTSFRAMEVLIALPVLVIGAAYPIITRAARDDRERFGYASARQFELATLVGVWLALTVLLIAPFATNFLGGSDAEPATAVLRIQALALIGTFVGVSCGFPLLALKRYSALVVANALGLAVTLLASLALIPALEARGAAIATVAAEMVLAVASTVAFVRAAPDVRLPLEVIPIALLAGGLGAGAGLLAGIHPLLDALVGTCVFALALVVMRRFPPEVGHALRGGVDAGRS
jgi:O-antigen/teichoic acid export membrane protein